jgi:hypothetical protein
LAISARSYAMNVSVTSATTSGILISSIRGQPAV